MGGEEGSSGGAEVGTGQFWALGLPFFRGANSKIS